MKWRTVMVASVALILSVMLKSAYAQDAGFADWLGQFRATAVRAGISPDTVDRALEGIEVDAKVIKLDRKQPENEITLAQYLANTVNARRVRTGRAMLQEYRTLLSRIGKEYGVQPEYIVALWGIESDFGAIKGNFSVIQSLATLAYEGRRADFFKAELLSALRILETEGTSPAELTGSWAGAMGDCQFIPSTYLKYAADGDHDGHRDIWNNPADIFASIANYLHALGWNPELETIENPVIPDDFKAREASIDHGKSAEEWNKRGFSVSYGNGMARLGGPRILYAIFLDKNDQDPSNVVLVTDNFKALLQWNRSRYFAAAVSQLAQEIAAP